ncbi:MAG: divalent metal cation transporter [Pirellulaceae bacterium]|jgi:Mn2+/Fe2+ NRAMP family transporter|nr:divalent metal cation transporter [Pirellulaceae bacterium]
MNKPNPQVEAERELLQNAQQQGTAATVVAYTRLSGPGWLQSAITLGGGSLSGALFLGVLGGSDMLWLQLVAIIMGVVMLSAISYVTLSTGERPFQSINKHINPALGWGWLLATMTANMIWCMPQFGLCYEALEKNLIGFGNTPAYQDAVADGAKMYPLKIGISAFLLVLAGGLVYLNSQQGKAAKIFDWALKLMVGVVVISFFGVVIIMTSKGELDWGSILGGFVPDLTQWTQPAGKIAGLVDGLSPQVDEFWSGLVVKSQRGVMIAAAATAVGINMTFLLPYSMLARGWDRPFRGLARFDLSTGMAIPYVLVTSCVVIAAGAMFHGDIDDKFASNDPAVMQQSPLYKGAEKNLLERIALNENTETLTAAAKASRIAALPEAEKRIAASLVKRNAFQLSASLSPLLGETTANVVFGIGVLGMGFSSIIILMLINGYALCEMLGRPQGGAPHVIGCLIAGVVGASWWLVWDGDAKMWLAILVSSFGMMLLPIAYITFFMMMNSAKLLGDDRPRGGARVVWNVLMLISVLGAVGAAATAVIDKASHKTAGPVVIGIGVLFVVSVIISAVGKALVGATPDPQAKP